MSGLAIALGIGVTLLSAIGAYFAAERQGREPGPWVGLCLIFSPLILVLIFLPKKGEPKQKRWFAIPLAAAGSISVVAAIAFSIWSFIQTGSASGFPQCGSALAHNTAMQAFAQAPIGKITGLAIIDFRNDREISSTDTVKQCTADVTLNNGTDHVADYRIEIRGNQYFVFIQVRP
jgi:hypothetical protein